MSLFLFVAAFVGGALNAVAGGGSFIGLPALIFAGVPAVSANATNTLALWPASMASAWAYRREVAVTRAWVASLGGVSLVGGLVGGLLLMRTSNDAFLRLLPWLLLAAAATFPFGGVLQRVLAPHPAGASAQHPTASGEHSEALAPEHPAALAPEHPAALAPEHPALATQHPAALATQHPTALDAKHLSVLLVQFLISVYGGYFGGGMGIVMLASLTIAGMTDIHQMNAVKSVLAVAINGVALAEFVALGAIAWTPGVIMIAGGIAGGYAGAATARRVDQRSVRSLVMVIAWGMTLYFFLR